MNLHWAFLGRRMLSLKWTEVQRKKLKACVNVLISLVHLAALKRLWKEGHFQFLHILTFSRRFCLFHDDQTIVSLERKISRLSSKTSSHDKYLAILANFGILMNNRLDSWNQSQVPTSPSSNASPAHAFRGESKKQNEARVWSRASDLLLAIDVQKRVSSSEFQRCARVTFACTRAIPRDFPSRAIPRDFLSHAILETESFLERYLARFSLVLAWGTFNWAFLQEICQK